MRRSRRKIDVAGLGADARPRDDRAAAAPAWSSVDLQVATVEAIRRSRSGSEISRTARRPDAGVAEGSATSAVAVSSDLEPESQVELHDVAARREVREVIALLAEQRAKQSHAVMAVRLDARTRPRGCSRLSALSVDRSLRVERQVRADDLVAFARAGSRGSADVDLHGGAHRPDPCLGPYARVVVASWRNSATRVIVRVADRREARPRASSVTAHTVRHGSRAATRHRAGCEYSVGPGREPVLTARRRAPRVGLLVGCEIDIDESRVHGICFHGIGTPRRILEPGEERYWIAIDAFHGDSRRDRRDTRRPDQLRRRQRLRRGASRSPALVERRLTASFFVARRQDRVAGQSRRGRPFESSFATSMTVGTHGMDHRPWRGLRARRPRARARRSARTDRRRRRPPGRRGGGAAGSVRPTPAPRASAPRIPAVTRATAGRGRGMAPAAVQRRRDDTAETSGAALAPPSRAAAGLRPRDASSACAGAPVRPSAGRP